MSERSRCAILRVFEGPVAPSAGIVRVGALRTFWILRVHPLRGSCVPSTLAVHFCVCLLACRTLCRDRACRSAPAVFFRTFWILRVHPLQGSCVCEHSRCAFWRMLTGLSHPLLGSCVSKRSRCAFLHIRAWPFVVYICTDRKRLFEDRLSFEWPVAPSAGIVLFFCVPSAGIVRSRCAF